MSYHYEDELSKLIRKKVQETYSSWIDDILSSTLHRQTKVSVSALDDDISNNVENIAISVAKQLLDSKACMESFEKLCEATESAYQQLRSPKIYQSLRIGALSTQSNITEESLGSSSASSLITPADIKDLVKKLNNRNTDSIRLSAIMALHSFSSGDLVCSENWFAVKEALGLGLSDSNTEIQETSLRIYSNCAQSAESIMIGDIYISLLESLNRAFTSWKEESIELLLKVIRLVLQLHYSLSHSWPRMLAEHKDTAVDKICQFLSLGPSHLPSPLSLFRRLDPGSNWLKILFSNSFGRTALVWSIKKQNLHNYFVSVFSEGFSKLKEASRKIDEEWDVFEFLAVIDAITLLLSCGNGRDILRTVNLTISSNISEIIQSTEEVDAINSASRILQIFVCLMDYCFEHSKPELQNRKLFVTVIQTVSTNMLYLMDGTESSRQIFHNTEVLGRIQRVFEQTTSSMSQLNNSIAISTIANLLVALTSSNTTSSFLINDTILVSNSHLELRQGSFLMTVINFTRSKLQELEHVAKSIEFMEESPETISLRHLSIFMQAINRIYSNNEGALLLLNGVLAYENRSLFIGGDILNLLKESLYEPETFIAFQQADMSWKEWREVVTESISSIASTQIGIASIISDGNLESLTPCLGERLNDIPRLSLSDYTFYQRLICVLSTTSASSKIIHQTEVTNELVTGFLRIFEDNVHSAELPLLDNQDFEIVKCLTKMLALLFTPTSLNSYIDAEENHFTERKTSLVIFIRQLLDGSDYNEAPRCEEMHCLVLRLLIAWCSNIDSLVLLNSHFRLHTHEIQSFANIFDLDVAVIDEMTLLKYRFRIVCFILGGPTEKNVQPLPLWGDSLQNYIPEDARSDGSQVPLPYLESSSPVIVDFGNSLEQLKVIAHKIILSVDAKLSLPNLKELLNAIISNLPVRQSTTFTTSSFNDTYAHSTPLSHQIENQQWPDLTLPHSFDLPIRLLSEYASRLHPSISTSTHISNLNNLFKSLKHKKWHRYNTISRSTENQKSDKPIPFDWVVGLVYLIATNVPTTIDVLENLAQSKTSLWFWWLLHDDLINHENLGTQLDFEIPFRFHVITQLVEVLLEKEDSCLYNSFTMSGMVLGQVTIPLLQTIFTTALNFPQRVHFLLLVLTHGPNYIVYYLVSFLRFYKTEIIKSCTNEMLPWELCNIIGGYHSKLYQLGEHWDSLKMLDKKYSVLVETVIKNIDGTGMRI